MVVLVWMDPKGKEPDIDRCVDRTDSAICLLVCPQPKHIVPGSLALQIPRYLKNA